MKRKSYIRRSSNNPRRKLEMQLDKLWQQAICAGNYCERCSVSPVAGHHLIPRAHSWHRHSLSNGVALCVVCHQWAHHEPLEFVEWLERTLPERFEYYEEHRNERSAGPVPISLMADWKDILRETTGRSADK